MALFKNRAEAGQKLAEALTGYGDAKNIVVYALPRGGVVLGAEVAQHIGARLDVCIARKIGHPRNPEYAICAVTEHGQPVCNKEELARLDKGWLEAAIEKERQKASRRRRAYLGNRQSIAATDKIAIVLDDGIATGLTMLAAIRDLKQQRPKKLIAAVPVAPNDTAGTIKQEVDEFIALEITPHFLGAVGAYYNDFTQVEDEEVTAALLRYRV